MGAWPEDKRRSSRIVFIGRNLDSMNLQEGFDACKAAYFRSISGVAKRLNIPETEFERRVLDSNLDYLLLAQPRLMKLLP